jgi:hypothetical protein
MWFFFGIFTLLASTIWGLRVRLAAAWRGSSERIGGHRFDVQAMSGKGRPYLVRIGTDAPAGLHFRVRAERLHDRFFKWLGVTTEIQTRDEQFDRTLFVESDARAVAILLRRNAKLRSALVSVFAYAQQWRMEKASVRCANKRVWLEFKPKANDDVLPAKTYLAPLLHAIASGLQSVDVPAEYKRDPFVGRAAAVLAFSTGTLALGMFGLMRSGDGRTDIIEPKLLFLACLVPALAVTAAAAFALLTWLIATSRAHTVVLEFVLVAGVGFVSGSYALAREANMDFDFQAARQVVIDVNSEDRVTKALRGGGKRHDYYIHCDDWRSGHEGERLTLEITAEMYQRLQGSRSAVIYVKPGLFGFDWVERIEPVRSVSQSR